MGPIQVPGNNSEEGRGGRGRGGGGGGWLRSPKESPCYETSFEYPY